MAVRTRLSMGSGGLTVCAAGRRAGQV